MSEYSILPLEYVVVLFPGFLVVRIPVHASSFQVSNFRDTLLSVTHLLVEQSGLLGVRVDVWLTIDDVVDLAASIVYAFAVV